MTDALVQEPASTVDVLWILDDSFPMSAKQERTVFQPSYAAVEHALEVTVGETLILADPVDGWTHDAEYAAIRFDGAYVAPRGSRLSVTCEVPYGGTVSEPETP